MGWTAGYKRYSVVHLLSAEEGRTACGIMVDNLLPRQVSAEKKVVDCAKCCNPRWMLKGKHPSLNGRDR